ncbi:hypothetical protein CKO12_03390 [Chromatium okenii]|nr:hypothetical protein [Chromatium okenii]
MRRCYATISLQLVSIFYTTCGLNHVNSLLRNIQQIENKGYFWFGTASALLTAIPQLACLN